MHHRATVFFGIIGGMTLCLAAFADLSRSPKETLVATVDGVDIHLEDIHRQIESVALAEQAEAWSQFDRFVDAVVREEVLFQYALKEVLKSDHVFRDRIKALVAQALIETRVHSQSTVSDAEVRQYYDQNPSQVRGEHWRARHIPLASDADCKRLLPQADSQESFTALARQYAVDPELAAVGGDTGYFMQSHNFLGLGEQVSRLPLHQPFVLNNDAGCHLIWMTEHIKPPLPPFADVANQLRSFLKTRKESELLQNLMIEAEDKIPVHRPTVPSVQSRGSRSKG